MISKELLSEVLEIPYNIGEVCIEDNKVQIYQEHYGYMREDTINIYELAHKCREWAMTQKKVSQFNVTNDKQCLGINNEISVLWGEKDPNLTLKYFEADTEVEAIFKACEYILDNR